MCRLTILQHYIRLRNQGIHPPVVFVVVVAAADVDGGIVSSLPLVVKTKRTTTSRSEVESASMNLSVRVAAVEEHD